MYRYKRYLPFTFTRVMARNDPRVQIPLRNKLPLNYLLISAIVFALTLRINLQFIAFYHT